MKKIAFLVCAGVLIFGSSPVSAQDSSNFGYSMPDVTFDFAGQSASLMYQNLMSQNILNSVVAASERNNNAAANREYAPSVGSTPRAMSFSRSPTRTRANLANFAAQARSIDRANGDRMARFFASTDILGQMGEALAPYGLRTDNVADAYAVYWISAWEASRGIVGSTETRVRVQAVKAQAAQAITQAPVFATATDAQKQEFADGLLVQAALISAHAEAAASDPAQMRAVSAAVRTGAKRFGLDLDTMELTPTGFVPS